MSDPAGMVGPWRARKAPSSAPGRWQGARWIGADLPAELYRRNGKPVSGIVIRRDELADDETCFVGAVRVTTPARTAFDLGRRAGRIKAVIRLGYGEVFARVDMGYEDYRVGFEYDGAQHWTDPQQHAQDIDRHPALSAPGWRVVRVSTEMLQYRAHVITQRTCDALRLAGAEWPVITRVLTDRVA